MVYILLSPKGPVHVFGCGHTKEDSRVFAQDQRVSEDTRRVRGRKRKYKKLDEGQTGLIITVEDVECTIC